MGSRNVTCIRYLYVMVINNRNGIWYGLDVALYRIKNVVATRSVIDDVLELSLGVTIFYNLLCIIVLSVNQAWISFEDNVNTVMVVRVECSSNLPSAI